MDEMALKDYLEKLAAENKTNLINFLGGGIYDHHIPSFVNFVTSRAEFYTSYTPYQSEISQGMLQTLFEYQSLITELVDMDVANASMYDAGTSLGEAALMCKRINRKRVFIVPKNIAPYKVSILRNYVRGAGMSIKQAPYVPETGKVDVDAMLEMVGDDTAGVYIESPNYFGVIDESVYSIKDQLGKTPLVAGARPLSLGVLKPPSSADIVIGEGQSLGLPMSYGGPSLGIFAAKKQHLRKMPGRLVGLTSDSRGGKGFCITIQTREQHIRRSRATSNICTNHALCAVAAAAYMLKMGSRGIRRTSAEILERTDQLKSRLKELDINIRFDAYHFGEVAIQTPIGPELQSKMLERGILAGHYLGRDDKELKNVHLLSVTERTKEEYIDALADGLKEVMK